MPPITRITENRVKELPFLINAIRKQVAQTEIPRHALLLGAGCSFNCGIPLGSGIIELCRMHAFINDEVTNAEDFLKACGDVYDAKKLTQHIKDSEYEEQYEAYLKEKDKRIKAEAQSNKDAYLARIKAMLSEAEGKSPDLWNDYEDAVIADMQYGSWINALSENEEDRQRFIEQMMADKKPDGAYILLSYLIAQRTFTNVLTTNFDDLINEALIYYTGTQCRFYADDELSKYISIHSSKPNIIKLHGDFRFANMSNTNEETSRLSPNLQGKLRQLLGQLGLIVIGYNGADHSIMSVLYDLKKQSSAFPLIWCGTDPERVHWRVAQLINNTPSSYFVRLESFEQLAGQLASYFLDNTIEQNNIVEAAQKRQALMEETLMKFKISFAGSTATPTEKEKLDKTLDSRDYFNQALATKSPEEKIQLYNKAIELDEKNVKAYNNRGNSYFSLKQYERAIEDYNKAIGLDAKYATAYYNRGLSYQKLNQNDQAAADFAKAKELGGGE